MHFLCTKTIFFFFIQLFEFQLKLKPKSKITVFDRGINKKIKKYQRGRSLAGAVQLRKRKSSRCSAPRSTLSSCQRLVYFYLFIYFTPHIFYLPIKFGYFSTLYWKTMSRFHSLHSFFFLSSFPFETTVAAVIASRSAVSHIDGLRSSWASVRGAENTTPCLSDSKANVPPVHVSWSPFSSYVI